MAWSPSLQSFTRMPTPIAIHRHAFLKNMPPDAPTIKTSASETWTRRLQLGSLKVFRILHRVAQAPAERLTKKLFLSTYEASDDAYWRDHATQYEWRSLGGIIEYTPDLLAMPSERAAPVYLIAIRATSNTYLERVVVKVKAKKSGVIHQQEITQKQLCGTPIRRALTAIPFKPKSSKGDGWQKLGDLYIKLVEAVDCDGLDLVKHEKIADICPLTGTDSVPHREVERWGQCWNIDKINAEKENIKARYYRELVQSARKLGRPLMMRRAAYRLLTSHLGLTLLFWSQNLGNAEGIRTSIAQAQDNDGTIVGEKSETETTSRKTAFIVTSTEAGS